MLILKGDLKLGSVFSLYSNNIFKEKYIIKIKITISITFIIFLSTGLVFFLVTFNKAPQLLQYLSE